MPIEHLIMWEAILFHKKQGVKYFETGYQEFGKQIYNFPLKKDLDISFFKRGFGGDLCSLYRGVKYYDSEFERKEKLFNLEKYFNYEE
jgi:hypothetical protein